MSSIDVGFHGKRMDHLLVKTPPWLGTGVAPLRVQNPGLEERFAKHQNTAAR